jgi:hypothetical protein
LQLAQQPFGHACGLVPFDQFYGWTALDHSTVKKALGGRHREQRSNLAPAAGLTEDHHVVGVASKLGNILPNPFQRMDYIEHARVSRVCEIRAAEIAEECESQGIEPMIDGDEHGIAPVCQVGSIVVPRSARAIGEAPAMAPEHHWPLTSLASAPNCRRPNVQNQTVLTLFGKVLAGYGEGSRCRWYRA